MVLIDASMQWCKGCVCLQQPVSTCKLMEKWHTFLAFSRLHLLVAGNEDNL